MITSTDENIFKGDLAMYLPQKEARNSSYSSNIHRVYSPKKKRVINLFSDLEYWNWLKIDCNAKVIDYCEQPLKIKGVYNGKKVTSIFDMWILYYNLKEKFQEVKPSNKLNPNSSSFATVQKQITVQKEWCKEHSKEYCIITEKDIFSNLILLNNLDKIHSFIRGMQYINTTDMDKLLSYLSYRNCTLRDLISYLNKSSSYVYSLVFFLVYIGKCTMDVYTKPIFFDTEVSLGCLDLD